MNSGLYNRLNLFLRLMKLTRKTRLTAALWALVGMLFMQLAVAAYACPDFNMSNGGASFSPQADTADDAMPGCDQPDPEQPALCHAHCQDQQQSFDKAELPLFPPGLVTGFFVAVTPVIRPSPSFGPLIRPTRTTDPPISIRNCCFRI